MKYQFAMDSIAAVYGSAGAVRRAKNEPPGAGNDHRSRFKSRICAETALQAAVILGTIDRSRFAPKHSGTRCMGFGCLRGRYDASTQSGTRSGS
jgi:hypothetical protein